MRYKQVAIMYKEVYEIMNEENGDILEKAGISIFHDDGSLSSLNDVSILVSGKFDQTIAERYPNLEAVIVPYTGLNGLDEKLIKSKNLLVFNSSAHGKFVAERALALTLGVLGKIVFYNDNMRNGNWSNRMEENRIDWSTLMGKKVGIYGYGTIGKKIHDLMKAFEVSIGIPKYKNRQPEGVMLFDDLESLAEWSEVFIIAAPLDDTTRASINDKIFKVLEDTVLINVGRGAIVDEDALYEALKGHVLKGFGSDVWFQYPKKDQKNIMPSKHPIHEFDHVIMTPHCAGFEETSLNLRCKDVADQIVMIMSGDYSRRRTL